MGCIRRCLARSVGRCARSVSQGGRQVILTTHSADLVDYIEPSELRPLARGEQGQTVLHKLDKRQLARWVKDFRLGELWKMRPGRWGSMSASKTVAKRSSAPRKVVHSARTKPMAGWPKAGPPRLSQCPLDYLPARGCGRDQAQARQTGG